MHYIQSDSNTIRDILKNFSLGSLIKVSTDSNDLSLTCDKSLMTFRMAIFNLLDMLSDMVVVCRDSLAEELHFVFVLPPSASKLLK